MNGIKGTNSPSKSLRSRARRVTMRFPSVKSPRSGANGAHPPVRRWSPEGRLLGRTPKTEERQTTPRPPRVLLVSPVPPPYGGIARWTRTLMDLDARTVGAELVLINTAHPKQRSDDTTLATRVVSGAAQIVRVYVSLLAQFTLHGRPSCVHINTSGSLGLVRDLLVLGLCRLFGVRTTLHLRFGRTPELLQEQKIGGIEPRLLLRALKLASTTISIDSSTRDAVTAEVGNRRSVFIPNFVDTSICLPRFDRESKSVLFLGSVTHQKGVKELLEAWISLSLDGWTLRLAGPVSPTMRKSISELTGQSIEVVGPVEHDTAMGYMYNAAFMVLPSHTEGFPNVVLEAMATGTPIIASAVGAIPQMLAGGAGLVVPPRDVDTLRQAVHRLVVDSALRHELAKAAHHRVTSQYSVEAVMAQYCRVWAP